MIFTLVCWLLLTALVAIVLFAPDQTLRDNERIGLLMLFVVGAVLLVYGVARGWWL